MKISDADKGISEKFYDVIKYLIILFFAFVQLLSILLYHYYPNHFNVSQEHYSFDRAKALALSYSSNRDEFDPPSISVYQNVLLISVPISVRMGYADVNEDGYLIRILDPNIKTFSLDVGVNRGKVIAENWLQHLPHLFAIGIEANYHLSYHLEHDDTSKFVRERSLIIRGAAASRRGIASFNTGAGWQNVSDTGSLFNWTDPGREIERKNLWSTFGQIVRLIRLDDVLSHVPSPRPPHFLWDTLKIDIQGADADALLSSGKYLENFVCVVGEFQTFHYQIPDGMITDPNPILLAANFTLAIDGSNNMVCY